MDELTAEARQGLRAAHGDRLDAWCCSVPGLVNDLLGEWSLRPTGEVFSGFGGIAVGVESHDGRRAVLKLTVPYGNAALEIALLTTWGGRGSVLTRQLAVPTPAEVAADDRVLRIDREWSGFVAELEQALCHPHRHLSDRALATAIATCRELGPDQPDTVLHGDLHGRNVMASDREPWLVIDPLGLVGEAGLECLTSLRDRADQLRASDAPARGLDRQIQAFGEAAETDHSRVRAWVQARSALSVARGIRDDHGLHLWLAETLLRPAVY